ncbi:hypothetical protein K1719_008786 [Acacia pycnantha]|nr:hypothetical protein K1719_008786 [Acacia pycnantha]
MRATFHCEMIANEAASFGRWAICQAAVQDQVADKVSTSILSYSSFGLVYCVGPLGWELMAYDDAGNRGPYYLFCMNSVDQEMTEGQEAAEEDTKWSIYLDFIDGVEK